MSFRLASILLVAAVTAAACGGNSPTQPTSSGTGSPGSTPALSSSHNAGRDCSGCHAFTVSGTAYRSDGSSVYPGAVIRLTTASAGGGTVVATLTADATGNFYTSASVSFGSGLFTTATGTGGAVRAMSGAITSGACNRCHGSGNRILVN